MVYLGKYINRNFRRGKTLSEFSSIIKFLSPRAWRVTRGEGKFMMIDRNLFCQQNERELIFSSDHRKQWRLGKSSLLIQIMVLK